MLMSSGVRLRMLCASHAAHLGLLLAPVPARFSCLQAHGGKHLAQLRANARLTRLFSSKAATAASAPRNEDTESGSHQTTSILQLNIPQFCCGCGVKLQQEDTQRPGYFQIPKKLLEDAQRQEPSSTAQSGSSGEEEQGLREFDAEAELWLDTARERRSGKESGDLAEASNDQVPEVLCARCYSLIHSGKVKNASAEGALPEFDLAKKVGRKIALQKDRRALVLCVVDVWDFDGSLPRMALRSLFPAGAGDEIPPEEELGFKLMVAVNKFDLLPREATPIRVEQWVRQRLRQAGLPRAEKVFMVSAVNGFGVRAMLEDIKKAMGFRADLWVVGAQNAGKSSLITAMKKIGGTAGQREPTVAPVPGTTLGLIKVPGIPLGPKHRTFDTPGVPHDYQLTSVVSADDVRLLLPKRRLKARTYRVGAGGTLLIGAVARVDIISSPGATLYITAFISDEVVCHMGKTEKADDRVQKDGGVVLRPPSAPSAFAAMEPLQPRTIEVVCDSWQRSTVDIAIAGLGWLAIGCVGKAEFKVWVPEQVAVSSHGALIPDFAKDFEKPGYSIQLPKGKSFAAR